MMYAISTSRVEIQTLGESQHPGWHVVPARGEYVFCCTASEFGISSEFTEGI